MARMSKVRSLALIEAVRNSGGTTLGATCQSATGGSSPSPLVLPLVLPLPAPLADPHRMNIGFPTALWGMAWELDQGTPDDPLFHDGLNGSKDGRFRIAALDPDPQNWIVPGDLNQVKDFSKNLWGDYTLYSHGYRLDAVMALF